MQWCQNMFIWLLFFIITRCLFWYPSIHWLLIHGWFVSDQIRQVTISQFLVNDADFENLHTILFISFVKLTWWINALIYMFMSSQQWSICASRLPNSGAKKQCRFRFDSRPFPNIFLGTAYSRLIWSNNRGCHRSLFNSVFVSEIKWVGYFADHYEWWSTPTSNVSV